MPRSNGLCRYGDAKVLSPTVSILCFFPIYATPCKSTIFINGFVGVSTQISLVFYLILSEIFLISDISTKST